MGYNRGFSSTFPSGAPGIGLLLLRVAVGLMAAIEGTIYAGRENATLEAWILGLLAIASGVSLLLGFLTAVSSVAAGLAASYLAAPNFFQANGSAVLIAVIAAAIVLLGPGALSVDARRFGRR